MFFTTNIFKDVRVTASSHASPFDIIYFIDGVKNSSDISSAQRVTADFRVYKCGGFFWFALYLSFYICLFIFIYLYLSTEAKPQPIKSPLQVKKFLALTRKDYS